MIRIEKGKEPKEWTKHRLTPGAKYEANDELRDALLKDQGYICAYCMRRIPTSDSGTSETSRIEHIVPQSTLTVKEAMDYSNMVICCPGAISGVAEKLAHCDRRKGEKPVSFSPFDSNFIKTISYKQDGTIISSNPAYDNDFNEVLNLNLPLLKLNRKRVKEEVIKQLGTKGVWKAVEIEKMIKAFSEKNAEGKLQPFCGVAIWFLNKSLIKINKQ